jgi:hypothetical protein
MDPTVTEGTGGLSVSEEMLSIIQQPGYLSSTEKSGQRNVDRDSGYFTKVTLSYYLVNATSNRRVNSVDELQRESSFLLCKVLLPWNARQCRKGEYASVYAIQRGSQYLSASGKI